MLPIVLQTESAAEPTSVSEVMNAFANEPDIRAVQTMASAYAKTNPEVVTGWLHAAKQAYLLPKLDLSYQKELNASDDYVYSSSSESQITDTSLDDNDQYEVKLEWRLDKIVMSSERIRVMEAAKDVVKLRDSVLEAVTQVYFDRRKLQVDLLLAPPADLAARMKTELEIQELTARLDAFTGGGFSAAPR